MRLLREWFHRRRFPGSERYWSERYAKGGDAGPGSQGRLAEFKAGVINEFVERNNVSSVIEFGCGDGGQLELAKYPAYLGFDVSEEAIRCCRERFAGDASRQFKAAPDYKGEKADLALSLDVIYHLVEESVFEDYMRRLFESGERFVIIYSSDVAEVEGSPQVSHVRQRKFTDWVVENAGGWTLRKRLENQYPYAGDIRTGSISDFFFYAREDVEIVID